MPKLTVIENGKKREIEFFGETILGDLLKSEDAEVEHPCGGKGVCGKCLVKIDGKDELSCKYLLSRDTTVEIPEKRGISSVTGAVEEGEASGNACLCLDIGTTTLALALVSPESGKTAKVLTATNPQRAFGADVISRIDFCRKNGVEQLKASVIKAVGEMTDEILSCCKLSFVDKMYVSGNTTMLHCFFGVDCSSMGVSPYTPEFLGSKRMSGRELGLDKVGEVVSLPNISAFVGADIVAGIGYVGAPKKGYNLLVDLGTNAEIALFDGQRTLCATAAAGPCFEGVNISCGMSASEGAVCAYFGEGSYKTIGDADAKGLCATGLVDVIAVSLKSEIIDESGYMEDDLVISGGVALTPKDVREFQLAKSAVVSAIECLFTKAGITVNELENIYVAGGFSSGLNVANAVYVGLLPKGAEKLFVPVNNSSLLGTVKYACGQIELGFVEGAEFVDVSSTGEFSERFFDNMSFEV